MSRALGRLKPEQCVFLICDVQEKFAPHIHKFGAVVTGAKRLLATAKALEIPVIVTEQYPKGLGHTVQELTQALEGVTSTVVEKSEFTMITEQVKTALGGPYASRKSVVIVGLEAHVCVQQTTLDLIEMGYGVHLCVDAISSQQPTDRAAGLHRADRAGSYLTSTESIMMELIRGKDHPQFKTISGVLKTIKFEDPLSFPVSNM
mmetsp:Transcript_24731/g.65219  ORF Transcript_24731/g.65219 Transcript_24731/m.65219 type:complete len:204 (+) Transcript_24731:43-654(+)